ncbi:MAG: hypothetical protein OEM46_08490 [Ignavibacteria bacterium]|nr:hypothetical protein [Ignavibacteria bacterium]
MKNKIRIASSQGFWGDLIDAPYHQVTKIYPEYISGSLEKELTSFQIKSKDAETSLPACRQVQH